MESTCPQLNAECILKLCDEVKVRDEDRVFFNKLTGDIAQLNPSGYATIRLLEEARTIRQIASILAQQWQVDPDRVEKDVASFFQSLLANHILQHEEHP